MRIDRFEDIEAWQLARELTRKVYALIKQQPFSKDYGLKGQVRNAAGFSMHNIAEGFDAETPPEFIRVLSFDLNPLSLVEDASRFYRFGESFFGMFIFFHVEENEPKEDARVPLSPARRHVGRRARKLAALRQVRALIPPDASMLGAGQRDKNGSPTD